MRVSGRSCHATTPMLIAANAAVYVMIAVSWRGQVSSVAPIANVAHSAAPAAQTRKRTAVTPCPQRAP